MGERLKSLQKLEVEFSIMRQELPQSFESVTITSTKWTNYRYFKSTIKRLFAAFLGEGNLKYEEMENTLLCECNNSSIAVASYKFTFTCLNFDESHKLPSIILITIK